MIQKDSKDFIFLNVNYYNISSKSGDVGININRIF